MIFRKRRVGHEQRLCALGHLLDQRGYERDGLCVLAVGEGFEVSGLRIPARGAAYDLAHEADQITAAEVEDALAHLGKRGRGW